jgi:hypothetical protein
MANFYIAQTSVLAHPITIKSLTLPKTGLIVNEPYLLHKKGVGRNSLTVH